MTLQVKEIKEKRSWENFLSGCQEKTFLQSWNWGEFSKAMGEKIWRLGVFEGERLLAVALIVKVKAKRGTFLFCPHGPNINSKFKIQNSKVLKALIDYLKEVAREEGASFIRIAPIWERTEDNIRIFQELGFRRAPIHMHAEVTWQLDITSEERPLLGQMRKTTRYLIRKGLRDKDLKVEKSNKLEGVEAFNQLYQKTVSRHQFVPFSLKYLKNQVLAFRQDNQVLVFVVKYKEEPVASAIIIFWQDIAFYHHGASSSKYPKIPSAYLLQWEVIQEAKNRGCKLYNFWGIAPSDKPSHPWAGLTLFKTGFGGYKKKLVKTQDFVLSSKYWLTFLIEKIRKEKRGL